MFRTPLKQVCLISVISMLPPMQPMQQQPQLQSNNQSSYPAYMYPQSAAEPTLLPKSHSTNGPPVPSVPYQNIDDAVLANQVGALNLGHSDNTYAGSYAAPPQQYMMNKYSQPMPYNNNPHSMPPGMASPPPMSPPTMVNSPLMPPSASLQPKYPAPQYVQQVQPTPIQPQPLYRGGYPPVGMMPPTPPAPQPAMPQKTQSARAMADSMPNAIEVIENDRAQRGAASGVVFQTGATGVAPPLSTTDFVCRDEGNCNPRFVRSSLYNVPTTADLQKQVGLPFVLSIQPFAHLHPDDQPLVLTDMGPQGPVRCARCKAYMCPFFVFIDGGRRFQCSLCGASTTVAQEYFAHLDHTGRRIDAFQRPELCLGSYEVVATAEYCRDNTLPLPPVYIFLLDVSAASVRSGLVNLFCSRFITDILPHLPRDKQDIATGTVTESSSTPISIGFITYDSQLHFYNFVRVNPTDTNSTALLKAHMNVVADTVEVFVPSLEGFLVEPNAAALTHLLSTIPGQFAQLQNAAASANLPTPEPILGPAVQAGLEVLKAANRCGKLFIMHSSLPTADAPGKLKFREDRHLIGTDKEKTLLQPATDYYTKLGKECVEAGASVDLFLFPNSFIDVATISEVPKLTSGNLFKYSYFQADLQGDQFIADLRNAVGLPEAFNAVMRVRTSTGTRPFETLGNINLPNATDVEFATLDANQTVVCEIKYDDKLSENDFVFIQVAVLYTSVGGHRRLRIHNLSLATSSTPADIFRLADLDTLLTWHARLAVQHAPVSRTPSTALTEVTAAVATALAGYRHLCTNSSGGGPGGVGASPGELVLPETIKLMPLYAQCLIKTDAIKSAKNTSIDDRAYLLFLLNSMSPKATNNFVYPRVYPLHEVVPETAGNELPTPIRCSYERLDPEGVYFVENGVYAFLWCGLQVNPMWIQRVFGVTDVHVLQPEKATLTELDNPLSKCICRLVLPVLSQFTHFPRLRVIRQNELSEAWIRRLMYEDRDDCGNATYVEYLCHVHKEVRALLK
ncbi:Protein transport protein Sec24C [Echinococcus granulosus]|nr:Protein transport protein Sec24C [Echinococcus granulosus]